MRVAEMSFSISSGGKKIGFLNELQEELQSRAVLVGEGWVFWGDFQPPKPSRSAGL